MKLPIAIASLAFVAQVAQAAEPIAVRITNGLPQLAQVDGSALAWRYVTVRADALFVRLEAQLSDCVGAPRVGPALASAVPPPRCSGDQGAPAPERTSQQLQARIRVPQLLDGAPNLELAVRNWRTTTRRSFSSTSEGSSAEVELTRPIGPVNAFAGYSVPVGRVAPSDDWRTSYAGFTWSPFLRHSMEVSTDWSRQAHGAASDRQASVVYSYSKGSNLRWELFVTRAVDHPVGPWRSGLGLDWTF